MLDRRTFLGALLVLPSVALAKGESRITLPPPASETGCDLLTALKWRRSTRAFAADALSPQTLSTLLWAADGINRPGSAGRTAPAAKGWYEIDIYAALPAGLYRYDVPTHSLERVLERDLRALTGTQDYVPDAPLDLVYVADYSRMSAHASEEQRVLLSAADTAVMVENVYLYCAAAGLATVVRNSIDRSRLAAAMGLHRDQRVVLAQSVGQATAPALLR